MLLAAPSAMIVRSVKGGGKLQTKDYQPAACSVKPAAASFAAGSSSELESHLMFARDAKIMRESEFMSLVSQTIEVRKMLCALMKRPGR
jgi:hypothetical protein